MADAVQTPHQRIQGSSLARNGRLRASRLWARCRDLLPRLSTRADGFNNTAMLVRLEGSGCPVCHSVDQHDQQFFFWFFSESYQDIAALGQFTNSLGFCRWHATSLMERVGSRSQLGHVHHFASSRLIRKLSEQSLGEPFTAPGTCPVCQSRAENMERAAFFLSRILHDPENAHRYGNPSMMCVPHLRDVALSASDVVFERLLEMHHVALHSAAAALLPISGQRSADDGAIHHVLRLALGEDERLSCLPGFAEETEANLSERWLDPIGRLAAEVRDPLQCPVCREVRRAWIEWMAGLDRTASNAEPIDDLLPTCGEHAWAAVRSGSRLLAMAVTANALRVAQESLDSAAKQLGVPPDSHPAGIKRWLNRAGGARATRLKGARVAIAHIRSCPVCARMRRAEDSALRLLFALLGKSYHRDEFEAGYGLCLKHFGRALQLGPEPTTRNFLIAAELAELRRLEWELGESLRKLAWDVRAETIGTEDDAPFRALHRFAGLLQPSRAGTALGSGVESPTRRGALRPISAESSPSISS